MCGTPVAAMRLGAAPEIVEEGVTGYCAASAEEFPEAVLRSLALDRRRVRERGEARFTAGRMAREYEHLYRRLASASAPFPGPGAACLPQHAQGGAA